MDILDLFRFGGPIIPPFDAAIGLGLFGLAQYLVLRWMFREPKCRQRST